MTAWGILDTGPLVAYLVEKEREHEWICEQFAAESYPVVTCEPVIVEALFLLRRYRRNHRLLFRMIDRGAVRIDFQLDRHFADVEQLMTQYSELPMSLADACIVCMAELNPRAEVITLDRHFRVYRTSDRRVLRLRTPGF